MRGQKTGIVGLGLIGQDLARRCELLGMETRWWGPRPKPDAPWTRMDSLLDLAKWCDNLVIAAKVDASNVGLISREVIEAVGPDGLIVNVARGQIIDEDAIIAALKTGTLGAAALDVFVEEPTPFDRWRDVPNTILTPHTAGAHHRLGAAHAGAAAAEPVGVPGRQTVGNADSGLRKRVHGHTRIHTNKKTT